MMRLIKKEPQGTKHPAALSSGRKKAANVWLSRLIPRSCPIADLLGGAGGRKQPSLRSQKASVGAGNSKFWRSGAKIYLNLKAASLLARFNSEESTL
jgi:hypothetical protein